MTMSDHGALSSSSATRNNLEDLYAKVSPASRKTDQFQCCGETLKTANL